ncbi:hypothetical protein GCM10025872_11150 [Barrientosiimonas endolithica]|uniref:Uncharacterized protein n=1 Tax=Barrientosiimonas endolithica TaxID=1535208 RepID=A0ABN6YPN0_9MICO|nr:hypothetical protein GCM10025872_11150 [Barrientosiimonas endolithica]
MEVGVEGVEVLAAETLGVHPLNGLAHPAQRGQPGVPAREAGRQTLEHHAHLGDVVDGEVRERHVQAQQPGEGVVRHRGDGGAAGGAGADRGAHDAVGLQGAHRLADRRATQPQLRGQLALGGQLVTHADLAAEDALLDPLHDLLPGAQAAGAARGGG